MKGKISRDLLELLIGEQREAQQLQRVNRLYELPPSNEQIYTVIGIRRCGKTVYLQQIIDELHLSGVLSEQILFLNFEDDRLFPIDGDQLAALLELFYEIFPDNHTRTCHIILDEVQNVEEWSKVVRRFIDTRNIVFYLSGSSSKLLSKEIASSLRGRSTSVELFPYSFKEYLTANNERMPSRIRGVAARDHLHALLDRYLIEGGFPALLNLPAPVRIQRLQSYIELVTFRDIVERHNVSNTRLLSYLINIMVSNSGSGFSVNKFYRDVKSQGYRAAKDTVYSYVSYIEDAFLVFAITIDSDSLRKRESAVRKIYAVDPGLVSALLFEPRKHIGALFETAVYLELRRRGGKLCYHITPDGFEIDFVHIAVDGRKSFYQVTYDLTDEKTQERELRALKSLQKETGCEAKLITRTNFWDEFYESEQEA